MKKMKFSKFCTVLVFLALGVSAFAQNTVVKGSVKDIDGQPIPGAAVLIDGTKTGTIADIDGLFSLTVPSSVKNPRLSVSCLSYKTEIIDLKGKTLVSVVLESDQEQLDEVVVVGYGYMRKSDLTGSISSVKIDEDDAARSTSVDQMLVGKAAGVEVISSSESPDAGVSIRIRGITSVNGSSEPLYVVDGVILTNAGRGRTGNDEEEEVNGLMGINPQDIASIQILKDASATAIYGAAGANGVVLITTKQANKDRPTINFNVGVDISTPYSRIDVLDFQGFTEYLQARVASGSLESSSMLRNMYSDYPECTTPKVAVRNWQEMFLKPAPRQRYFLSISGRPKTISYTVSLGYNTTKGVVEGTSNEQFTARMDVSKDFTKKFKIGTKINFAYIRSRTMQGAGSGDQSISSSFIKSLVSYRPYVTMVIDEDEEYEDEREVSQSSPSKWAKNSYQTRNEYRAIPSFYAQYKILDWLTFKSSFGGDYHMQEIAKFKGLTVSKSPASGGVTYGETYNWNWDTTLSVNKKFKKKHKLSGTLGFTMSRYHSNTNTVMSSEVAQYGIGTDNLDSSIGASMTFGEVQTSKMSFFTRAIYSYSDRYILTATYRLDGSSMFPTKNKFASFPSLAAAWNMHQENWFESGVISMMKLRFGWGMVGNCSMSPYQYLTTFGTGRVGYHFNDAGYINALSPSVFANEDLKWETTQQFNGGLDYGMLDGRIVLSVDMYYKRTYDLLQKRNVSYNTGFASIYVNQGQIVNKGLEINLETIPVTTDDIEWALSGNITFNRNNLLDIGYEGELKDFYFEPGVRTTQRYYTGSSIGTGGYLSSSPLNVFMQGQPLGLIYGYRTDGLVQEGEYGIPINKANYENGIYAKPGSIRYVDMNGNGYIDADDRTVIGNASPKFVYGFSTSFSWKDLRISANFNGSFGNNLYNANITQWSDTHRTSSPINVVSSSFRRAWTVANPSNRYVALSDAAEYYGTPFQDVFNPTEGGYITDRDVEDASYLRLANVAASYSLKLPKKSPLSRIVFAFSVNNAVVFTRYTGFSPIVNSYKISSQKIGIDSGGYPLARSYCFDVKFTF